MNKELLDYIKALSLKDKKTLSQKALKVSEETGELARVVLPFDNAHGSKHKFTEKHRILEEVVDVILSSISIAYELEYSHEEIEEVMIEKASKWQSIQAKEEKIDDNIPYEIHVTVDLGEYVEYLRRIEIEREIGKTGESYYTAKSKNDLEPISVEYFKEVCKQIGVKPIVLDLENDGESVMKDVMTSSHCFGNNASSYIECIRIEKELREAGFNVVRKKIETVPWHPAAPTVKGDKMPGDCYFEAHIGCVISPEEKEILVAIALYNKAHLSKNFFKKLEDGKFVNMLTTRSYTGTFEEFEVTVEHLKNKLTENKIKFEKVITEFAIYDTKVSHDFMWLETKKQEA